LEETSASDADARLVRDANEIQRDGGADVRGLRLHRGRLRLGVTSASDEVWRLTAPPVVVIDRLSASFATVFAVTM
jgi:hypothetical protein